jgi:acyl-lipid omega-6 desaturase (Delta-12 desaturase)
VAPGFAGLASGTGLEQAGPNGMTTRPAKELIAATRPHQRERRWLSWFHLISGLLLMLLGMLGAMLAPWWALRMAAVALAALSMLKLFIVYHDYMHRALLKRSRIAKLIMHAFGYFILAPPAIWKRTHDFHHAHNAKLASSQVGSFPTLSTLMYERLPPAKQRAYRLARSPWAIVLGWLTIFLIGMCAAPFVGKPRENRDGAIALVLYAALAALVIRFAGLPAYLLGVVLPHAIAAAVGSYLFYAQHNFPGVELRSRHDWEYGHAALASSSYCRMGPVMRWFSGNIGYHHVHHLNSAIPFYNLPRAMADVPELGRPVETSLSLSDVTGCLDLKLWDPTAQAMVRFPR